MSAGLLLAGRYQLSEKLGAGGMGSVWRALDRTLNAEVAVKLIDPELAGSDEAMSRFRREAQAAAAIRSTHVVQTLDYGVDNGVPFIAMELLKGESLAQRLERVNLLSPPETGDILVQVARALAIAHGSGIVHRDLKPDNIFLVREGDTEVCKVLDFGIARQRGGLSDSGGVKTKTGAVLGTPYYMSPEQAIGQGVDQRTDIWAFGVIAAECLTGRRAFEGDSLGGLFHAICMAPLTKPSVLGIVPTGFDAWFFRAVAREKSERFQSIKEAAEALKPLCERSGSRPSSGSFSDERGGTAVSAGVEPGATATRPLAGVGLHTTTAPASQSIAYLPRTGRRAPVLIAIVVAAVVSGGLYAGWRWSSSSTTANTAPSQSATAMATPSPVPVATPSPVQSASATPTTALAPPSTIEPAPGVSVPVVRDPAPRANSKPGGAPAHQRPEKPTSHQAATSSVNPPKPTPENKTLPAAAPTSNDRLGI
jgi:eukaryotic-like serine/threonine-protein kinase